jgi:hypothetical protein
LLVRGTIIMVTVRALFWLVGVPLIPAVAIIAYDA